MSVGGSRLDIIAIGNLNMDLTCEVARFPRRDEKLLARKFLRAPGGGAANFAVACSRLGLASGFIGSIGKDNFGDAILKNLKREHIDVSHIKRVGLPTGSVFIFLTPKGEHLMVEYRGANSALEENAIEDGYLRRARLVHASSVALRIASVAGLKAKKFGICTSLDIGAELVQVSRNELLRIIGLYDICFMNANEYAQIFSAKPSRLSIVKNMPRGLEVLVVKLGRKGVLAAGCGKAFFCRPPKVQVKNTTGAGDAFAAAFDAVWLEKHDLKNATEYALAEAAMKIQRAGAMVGLPKRDELEQFMESFAKNNRFS